MDLDLTREQKILKRSAQDFLKKECPPSLIREMKDDERGYPQKLWDQMVDLGWTGVMIPDKYGGIGGSYLDLCILLEAMGEVCCPGPFFSTVVLGGLTLLSAGTEEQKGKYLPGIADGDLIFTLAMIEPGIWYDISKIAMSASIDSDDFVLNGTKLFVENGHIADYLICVARTDSKDASEAGLTLFLVDNKSAGVRCSPQKTLGYDRRCEIVFDKVRVPKSNVLGDLGRASGIFDRLQEQAAVAKCAELVGCIQTAFDMTVKYAKNRKQFGRPIGSFQAVQHHCANMVVDVDGARFITYQAAWKISEGLAASKEAAMAKAWTSDASRRVTSLAHQIHGAISFAQEYDVHLFYRRAKACEVAFGDAEYHLEKVAAQLGL
ncbi:MAG: acyl-CoA/acyl-ACP dehydrogenase [Deltaproteobacteria bacterium]|nr:MAG: acyl-CoA/acyl-ACP dehydrogenase [Deltaproteobacteria bacterium]